MTFFSDYKKHALKKQIGVLLPAFIAALAFNVLFFTETGHRVSSSIVHYEGAAQSDISIGIDVEEGIGEAMIHQDIQQADSIHFTLLYDPNSVIMSELASPMGEIIQITEIAPHVISIDLGAPTAISAQTDILTFSFLSLSTETQAINLTDAYFLVDGQRYELAAQGSGPF